jgi:hypothetical protein
MEIDLDINNYDLSDLLKLFNLDYDFTVEDLKKAKKIALMTHPDKSGLDKKFFFFFSAAYKAVYEIYNFRHTRKDQSISYDKNTYINEEREQALKNVYDKYDKKTFNKWFNEQFNKSIIKDEYSSEGYGDWLISNDDVDNRHTTMENMNNSFEKKKRELRAIVVNGDYRELGASGLCELTNDRPENYSSDIFSKLQFEDLKKAHTETVIPVTMEDYINRRKYKNVNELNQERTLQNNIKPSYAEHKKYLDKKILDEGKNDTERAYRLIKQDMEIEKINKKWWGGIMRLTN